MNIIPLAITLYIIFGVIFMSMIEENQPKGINGNKFLYIIVGTFSVIFWIPWLLLNMCFPKRDIWFRRKIDDR